MRSKHLATGVLILALQSAPSVRAEGAWQAYSDWFDGWADRVVEMDLYGLTAQLPKGVFGWKLDMNTRTAVGRYDDRRVRKPIVEPITFGDVANPSMILDLGASGGGAGYTLQFSYGLTDPLDFYVEIPLVSMDVQVRPKLHKLDGFAAALIGADPGWFGPDGSTLSEHMNEASAYLIDFLTELGRPRLMESEVYPQDLGPGKQYTTNGVRLADVNLGCSWNYHRSSRWSGALTGRVFLPTGGIADPNNALVLGTGPALDRGTGSFGVSFTKGYDVRIVKYSHWIDLVLSSEVSASYHFKSHRRYPDFPKPTARGEALLDLLDPERQYFPDMSDLTGQSYGYTPGLGFAATLGVGVHVLLFGFAATMGYGYFQEAEFDADPRFVTMVRSLELSAAGHMEELQLSASVNLAPLHVPLELVYIYQKSIGGRNSLIFGDNHWFNIRGVLPSW